MPKFQKFEIFEIFFLFLNKYKKIFRMMHISGKTELFIKSYEFQKFSIFQTPKIFRNFRNF